MTIIHSHDRLPFIFLHDQVLYLRSSRFDPERFHEKARNLYKARSHTGLYENILVMISAGDNPFTSVCTENVSW